MEAIKQDTLWWQKPKREFTDLKALSKYFETCNRSDGKSKDTINWYNQTLKQFEKFLVETGKPTDIADIGEPEVREYIIYLQDRCRWPDKSYANLKVGSYQLLAYRHMSELYGLSSDGFGQKAIPRVID